MSNFLMVSVIGSIVLTLLLNILPVIFPKAANKIQEKISENARKTIEQHQDENQPRVKVFFPWKAMLLVSIVLTLLVNVVGYFSS